MKRILSLFLSCSLLLQTPMAFSAPSRNAEPLTATGGGGGDGGKLPPTKSTGSGGGNGGEEPGDRANRPALKIDTIKADAVIPNITGPTGQKVRFVGREVGKYETRVYTFERPWPDLGKKTFGTLRSDGQISWDVPAKYAEIPASKRPLPQNQSLVPYKHHTVQRTHYEAWETKQAAIANSKQATSELQAKLANENKVEANLVAKSKALEARARNEVARAKFKAKVQEAKQRANQKAAEVPLPRNRALIITNPVPKTPKVEHDVQRTQSEAAEVTRNAHQNSNGFNEYFVEKPGTEKPEVVEAEKPSRLAESLGGWTEAKANAWKKSLQRVKTRSRWMIRNYKRAKSPESLQAEASPLTDKQSRLMSGETLQIGKAGGVFYLALGVAAALTLMSRYPSDPVAWENYLNNFTDVVGMASFAGFIATAGWVYKMLPSKNFRGQMGVFGLSMVAGSLVSDAINDFANDPSVLACNGFPMLWSLSTGGLGTAPQFIPRNITACDQAHEKWSSKGRYADALYPTIAGMLASTAIFMGGTAAIHYGAAALAIKGIRIPKFPGGGAGTAVLLTGQMLLFFGADWVANELLGIEQYFKQVKIATFKFAEGDALGKNTLYDSEDKLFYHWSTLRAQGWKDVHSVDKITALLERYAQLQKEWRQTRLMPAFDRFQSWMHKVSDFDQMQSYSYDIYKNIYGFTQELRKKQNNDSQLSRADKIENQKTEQRGEDPGSVRGFLNFHRAYPLIPAPNMSYDLSFWQGIDTKNPLDYVLTAMACGPDAEASQEPGWKDYFLSWAGMTNSDHIVSDPSGSSARFYPPRLVKDSTLICDQLRSQGCGYRGICHNIKPSALVIKTDKGNMQGIETYLENYLRDDIPDFDAWWRYHVTIQVLPMKIEFQNQFHKMMSDYFVPNMNEKEYYECKPNPYSPATGLDVYFQVLGRESEKCELRNTRKVAYGVINSLRDEMALYLSMLLQLTNDNQMDLLKPKTVVVEEAEVPASIMGQPTVMAPQTTPSVTTQTVLTEMTTEELEERFITPAQNIMKNFDLLAEVINSREVTQAQVDAIEAAFGGPLKTLNNELKRPSRSGVYVGRKLLYNVLIGRIALLALQATDYAGMMAKSDLK